MSELQLVEQTVRCSAGVTTPASRHPFPNSLLAIPTLFMIAALFGCAGRPNGEALRSPAELVLSREEALARANYEWIDAINRAGAIEGLAGMTDDAAIIPPGGPIAHGTEELRKSVEILTRFPGLHVDFTLTKASVSADGRVGFVVGDSKITTPSSDGILHTTGQRLLTVWRKDQTEKWRCYLDVVMGTTGPPGP